MEQALTYDKYDEYDKYDKYESGTWAREGARRRAEARVTRAKIRMDRPRSPADDTCRGSSAILVTSCSRLLRYERYETYGACGVRNTRRMGKPKPWACSRDGLGPTPRVPDRGTTGSGVSTVRRAERQKTLGGQVGLSPDSQRKLWEALLRAVSQPDWAVSFLAVYFITCTCTTSVTVTNKSRTTSTSMCTFGAERAAPVAVSGCASWFEDLH